MHFTGNQTVQGPEDSFSANCKQKKIGSFWWTSSQNRARRAFVVIKL